MSRQGDQLRHRLAAGLLDVRKDLIAELAANLDEEMPVDTSWARSNTIPSVGPPTLDPVGSPKDVDNGPRLAGLAEVLAARDTRADLHIANNVPYIDIIDQTHPTAKGLVERSIEKAEAAVRARSATRKVDL